MSRSIWIRWICYLKWKFYMFKVAVLKILSYLKCFFDGKIDEIPFKNITLWKITGIMMHDQMSIISMRPHFKLHLNVFLCWILVNHQIRNSHGQICNKFIRHHICMPSSYYLWMSSRYRGSLKVTVGMIEYDERRI